jgi:hypothetical protein
MGLDELGCKNINYNSYRFNLNAIDAKKTNHQDVFNFFGSMAS